VKQGIKFKLAERNLSNIARHADPVMSRDEVIEGCTQELEQRLASFKADFLAGSYA
jgi:hypothetical protein